MKFFFNTVFVSFLLAQSFRLSGQYFSGFATVIPVVQSNFGKTVLFQLSKFCRMSQDSAGVFTAILLALAFQRQILLCLTTHLIDF